MGQQLTQQQQQQWAQQLDAWTAGQGAPASKYGQHALHKLKEGRAKVGQLNEQIASVERQLLSMRDELRRYEGMCQQCGEDLIHWETEEGAGEPSTPPPQTASFDGGSLPPAKPLSPEPVQAPDKPKGRPRKAKTAPEPLLPGLPTGDAAGDN